MNKDKVVDCANEVQNHMFRGLDSDQSREILEKSFDKDTIMMAMEMIKQARIHDESPYKQVSEVITRCMSKVEKQKFENIEQFYEVAERAYKVFMNDEEGRAIPVVFMYIEGNTKLGVCPITECDPNKSPMDYLKQVVYTAKPDAYCFCAEASMSKDLEKSQYKYGDIQDDPDSVDVMVMTGNSKSGNDPFNKGFELVGKEGKLKFKEIDDYGNNMESEKTP